MFSLLFSIVFAQTLTLRGVDSNSNQFCYLYVEREAFQPYSVVATTGYTHNGDRPQAFTLRMAPGRNDALSGTGANRQDQLIVLLRTPNGRAQDAKSFNLRWKHGNHFDVKSCQDLKIHVE